MFCCDDGTVKVLDFGIAQVAGGPKLTVEGTVLGSVSYLSPEQARGRSDIDPTTDVRAMGVVMYEALTGTAPFDRDTPLTTILQIIQGNYVRLEQRAPHIPRPLCEIVDRCLQRSPTARYPNGAALVSAMESLDALDTSRISVPTGETQFVRVSLPPGEERIVVVLLARGARSPQAIEAAITELGGEAIPFLGEGVIGLFGGTSWEGDEVERAVEAALRCREAADSVAVGSGRVRSTGSDVSGAAVMAAERGCQAHLDGVALDAPTARTLAGRFELVSRADGLVEVTARRRDSSVAAPASSSSALGRDLELARIRAAVEDCRAGGTPQVVEVIGPLGIGKSKLRAEMLRMLAPGVTVLTGRGEPMRADVALHLWGSVLARHLRAERPDAEDDASRAEAIDRLATETLEDEHGAVVHAAFLRELLGVPGAEPAPLLEARADPQLMSDRLRLTILDFVGALARRGPLAIVLEDLQWADRASVELLERLGDDISGLPVLIFLTSRQPVVDTEMGGLSELPVDRIELSGLPPAAARELALAAAGVDLPEPVLDELAQRSEGNPFFLEQMAMRCASKASSRSTGSPTCPCRPRWRRRCSPASIGCPRRRGSWPGARASSGARSCRRRWRRSAPATPPRTSRCSCTARSSSGPRTGSPSDRRSWRRSSTTCSRRRCGSSCTRSRPPTWSTREASTRKRPPSTTSAPEPRCPPRAATAARRSRRRAGATSRRCCGAPAEPSSWACRRAICTSSTWRGRTRCASSAVAASRSSSSRPRSRTRRTTWSGARAHREDLAALVARAARRGGGGGARGGARGHLERRRGGARSRALSERGDAHPRRASRRRGGASARGGARRARPAAAAPRRRARAARPARRRAGRSRAGAAVVGEGPRAAARQRRPAPCGGRAAEPGRVLQSAGRVRAGGARAARGARGLPPDGAPGPRGVRDGQPGQRAGAAGAGRRGARRAARRRGARARGMKDDRLLLYVRAYRATALSTARRWQEAVDTAMATAHDAREQGRKALEVIALSVAAIAQLELGRTDEALASSERALELRDELGGLDEREGEVFLARALALSAAGRQEEAAAVRERGRERVREIARRIRDDAWRERFLADVAGHRALLA
ncbi:MAG: AAA family ATPase [Sandaracinaceae bacterium]|nr:AAA family ATPase [Sandaracinaceae bacterium]